MEALDAFDGKSNARSTRASQPTRPARVETTRGEPEPPGTAAALVRLCTAFALSNFERDVLLMCAGAELDPKLDALYGRAHDDPRRAWPTFGLALAMLPDPHWSALTPAAPLRRWRLLDVVDRGAARGQPSSSRRTNSALLLGNQHIDSPYSRVR